MAVLRRKRKLCVFVLGTTAMFIIMALTTQDGASREEIHNMRLKQENSGIEDVLIYSRDNTKWLNDSNDGHIYTFLPMDIKVTEKKGKMESIKLNNEKQKRKKQAKNEKENDKKQRTKGRKREKQEEEKQENGICQPQKRILFLKTHKTGSSTITSILQVYGFLRNLTFAVPKEGAQILSRGFFKLKQVRPGKYDMLVNHARYDRSEMEKVMKPGAKYITIIRDPSTQIESNFAYFRLVRTFELQNESNPFKAFVENPSYYWEKYKHSAFRNYMKNPNLFDLGLSEIDQENLQQVNQFITRISREFDLVLIQEYFNESLLLLKKLLCWEMEDILYLSKGRRSPRAHFKVDRPFKESIRKWSWADMLLYDHFNKTLWRKIQEYGSSFKSDLAEFETKLNETLHECTLPGLRDNRRETYFRKNPKGGPKCVHLMRIDLDFTKLIRRVQYGEQPSNNNLPKLKPRLKNSNNVAMLDAIL